MSQGTEALRARQDDAAVEELRRRVESLESDRTHVIDQLTKLVCHFVEQAPGLLRKQDPVDRAIEMMKADMIDGQRINLTSIAQRVGMTRQGLAKSKRFKAERVRMERRVTGGGEPVEVDE